MLAAMRAQTRRHLEAMMQRGDIPFLNEFTRSFYDKGRAEGRAEERRQTLRRLRALLSAVLARRGLHVDAASRTRIDTCDDVDRLMRWIDRATYATSVEEALRDDA